MRTQPERTAKEALHEWFTEELYHSMSKQNQRLRKLTLRFVGSDWLAIITMLEDDEYYVGFLGASSLLGLAAKARTSIKDGTVKWKIDEFADRD